MRKIIIGLNLILILSVFAAAQKQRTDPEDEKFFDPPRPSQSKKDSSAKQNQDEELLKAGTNLEATLKNTLDVKKSEVGDEVVLKTTKSIKQDGEVVIPKGTKLIGRVTEVQRKTKENSISKIGLVFEKLEGKDFTAPINLSIVSIFNSQNRAAAPDLFENSTSSSSRSSGRASTSRGGGLLGGATSTVGGVLNTTTSTVGGVAGSATQTVGGVTQGLVRTVDGIQISQSANSTISGSSTLSAEGKNLKIKKGATFQLMVNESVEM